MACAPGSASWPTRSRAGPASTARRSPAIDAGPILLTALVVAIFLYPVINDVFYQPISRSIPLPLPSDPVVVFMLIFAIMAVGLNIVIGFAGLLDLGYVAFYAIGAYTMAFLASPHWGGLSITLFAQQPPGFPGIHLPFF